MSFVSLNPATEQVGLSYPKLSDGEIDIVLRKGQSAFRRWSNSSITERAIVLQKVGHALENHADSLAASMTGEMGKPISQAKAEVLKSASLCYHLSERVSDYLAPRNVGLQQAAIVVQAKPLGLMYSITPWNFPVWQMIRFAAPALAAGNTVVVKPAPNVMGVSDQLIRIITRVDGAEDLYQCLAIDHHQSDAVIADPRIAAVGFTGSETAGSAVATVAGRHLKKIVLELGGSDPFIVFQDADIQRAVSAGVQSRFTNAGQVCIAAKRFIIADSIYDIFKDAFIAEVERLQVGDPQAPDTFIGPMARQDLRDELDRQTQVSIGAGAKVLIRGGITPDAGFYYAPTVLEAGLKDSPASREELFGPTAVLWRASNEAEAIQRANATRFGLSASIWTEDMARGRAAAQCIEAGSVFINMMSQSHPAAPIGGTKCSGHGRELGQDGIRELTNIKSVWEAGPQAL